MAKWIAAVFAAIVLLSIGSCALGVFGGYAKEGKRVISVENVKEQNTQIIESWEAMQAAAANVCNVGDPKKHEGDPTLVEDPALAYKATYRNQAVEYNRRMHNLYEAQAVRGLPLPSNLKSYPETAPTLEQTLADIC